MKTLTMES